MTVTGVVAAAGVIVDLAETAAALLNKGKQPKGVQLGVDVAQTALGFLQKITEAGNLIKQAQAEGREITDAEIQQLKDNDDLARTKLELGIANATK